MARKKKSRRIRDGRRAVPVDRVYVKPQAGEKCEIALAAAIQLASAAEALRSVMSLWSRLPKNRTPRNLGNSWYLVCTAAGLLAENARLLKKLHKVLDVSLLESAEEKALFVRLTSGHSDDVEMKTLHRIRDSQWAHLDHDECRGLVRSLAHRVGDVPFVERKGTTRSAMSYPIVRALSVYLVSDSLKQASREDFDRWQTLINTMLIQQHDLLDRLVLNLLDEHGFERHSEPSGPS